MGLVIASSSVCVVAREPSAQRVEFVRTYCTSQLVNQTHMYGENLEPSQGVVPVRVSPRVDAAVWTTTEHSTVRGGYRGEM
jgi:hypothetical protein